MHTLATFIRHSIGSPSGKNQKRKIKCIQIRRDEAKLSLSADNMLVDPEHPREAKENLLETQEFSEAENHW